MTFVTIKKSLKLAYNTSKKYFFLNLIITIVSGTTGYFAILSNKLLLNNIQVFLNNKNMNGLIEGLILYAIITISTIVIKFTKQYYLSKQRAIIQSNLDIKTMKKNGKFTLEDFENSNTYTLLQEGNELGIDICVGKINYSKKKIKLNHIEELAI